MNRKKYPFPLKLLLSTIILTVFTLIWIGISAYNTHKILKHTLEYDMKLEELRGSIIHLDEVLTMSARMAAITGDKKWIERYNYYEPILGKTINQIIDLAPKIYEHNIATKTHEANIELVKMEVRALKLIEEGNTKEAQDILFSDNYDNQKNIYSSGMNDVSSLLQHTISQNILTGSRQSKITLIGIIFIIIFLIISWISTIRHIKNWEIKVTHDLDNKSDHYYI